MSSERIGPGKATAMSAQPFVYRSVQGVSGQSSIAPAWGEGLTRGPQPEHEQAWQRGFEEGKKQASREFQEALAQERQVIASAIADFVAERNTYFRDVEPEVVRLALAIARRILHREAQLDPLVLSGAVRVALEKASGSSVVKLHVHPSQMAAWENFFTRQQDLSSLPVLVPDPALEPDRCVLHTALGTTEIHLESQLKEVEQGFFDLLERRPRSAE